MKTALGITESKDYTTLCFLQGYKSALEFVCNIQLLTFVKLLYDFIEKWLQKSKKDV